MGAVFDAGILTPPAALFERDSLPVKGRDEAVLDCFAGRAREVMSKSDLPGMRTAGHRAAASVAQDGQPHGVTSEREEIFGAPLPEDRVSDKR